MTQSKSPENTDRIPMILLLRLQMPKHEECTCPRCLQDKLKEVGPSAFFESLGVSEAETVEVLPFPSLIYKSPLFLKAFSSVLIILLEEWQRWMTQRESGNKRSLLPPMGMVPELMRNILGFLEGVSISNDLMIGILQDFKDKVLQPMVDPEVFKAYLLKESTHDLRIVALQLGLITTVEAETIDHTTLVDKLVAGSSGMESDKPEHRSN